jgi:cytochrome c oxidase subunit IV
MDAHAHAAGHGKDHVPHVLPLSTYLKTWGALLVLTAVTVGASYVDFGAANLWIALLIASAKAATVALVFMHLYWDHKFHAVIFGVSLVFLAIFIIFTLFDTQSRGRADGIEGERPADIRAPFAGTRTELDYKEKHPELKATAAAAAAAAPKPSGEASAAPKSSAEAAPAPALSP